MTGAALATGAGDPPLSCGNCRQPMRRLDLHAHYGTAVELDLCERCDWLWFDGTETARLDGPSLLALIGEMARSHALPHELLGRDPRCPRCDGAVALVHNQSRWGRSSQLQCRRRHGAFQTFSQFLHEKGLVRAMSRVDRAKLLRDRGQIACVNCGGAVGAEDETCRWCRSVPSLLDIARLAHALDPHETIEPQVVHRTRGRADALQCAACGAALPPGESASCAQCGATLAVTDLAEANAAVQALAPALREAAKKPSAKVVQRRLDALREDIPRRRAWVAELEAGSSNRNAENESGDWQSRFAELSKPVRAAVLALLALVIWRWWR